VTTRTEELEASILAAFKELNIKPLSGCKHCRALDRLDKMITVTASYTTEGIQVRRQKQAERRARHDKECEYKKHEQNQSE
jgi:hypothetical protein